MILGIDLGTSNSAVAIHDGDSARIIPLEGGDGFMPSAVFLGAGFPVVGSEAIERGRIHPQDLMTHFKRLIGRKWSDDTSGGNTVEGEDGYVWLIGPDRHYSPYELSAMILYALRVAAADHMLIPMSELTEAVICIPASFDNLQREQTEAAAVRAGFEKVHMGQEPTAAALTYGVSAGVKLRTGVVFDWGGGTFDVSVIRAKRSSVEVVATDGDPELGGRDVDEAIARWIQGEWVSQGGGDLRSSELRWARVMEAAEAAKIALSQTDKYRIVLQNIEPPRHLDLELTAEKLTELARPLIDRAIGIARRLLARHSVSATTIDDVLLVGGMTFMPAVRRAVQECFGRIPRTDRDPRTVVALGAATRGAVLEGRIAAKISDVAPHTLTIDRDGGVPFVVAAKGAAVPMTQTVCLTTAGNQQQVLSLILRQGSGLRSDQLRVIGRHWFEMSQPVDAGEAEIEITVGYDATGGVTVQYDGKHLQGGQA